MKLVLIPFQLLQDNNQILTFEVKDDNDAIVDVSTGWKAKLICGTLNQPDRAGDVFTLVDTDFAYFDGYITTEITPAMLDAVHTGTYGFSLWISDDDFATHRYQIGTGQIQVVPSVYAL